MDRNLVYSCLPRPDFFFLLNTCARVRDSSKENGVVVKVPWTIGVEIFPQVQPSPSEAGLTAQIIVYALEVARKPLDSALERHLMFKCS